MAAAGVVAGLLAGVFGIGGGAVLVPVFYQVFGLIEIDEAVRMHLAVGSSLGIIVPTSIRSFMAHKARGAVDMEVLRSFLIAGAGRRGAGLADGRLHLQRGPARHLRGHHDAGRRAAAVQPGKLAPRRHAARQSDALGGGRGHRLSCRR
jgi:uncharacterized membrane protein YfcA